MTRAILTPERGRPEIAAAIEQAFGARQPLAVAYAELLCTAGIERGMLGPREAERVWERHLLNCAVLAPLVPPGSLVVDLGSGAGLPGVPLAIARPDLRVVLLEPMQRRVRFLQDCLETVALPGVSVHHGRAEDGIPEPADVVVARAVTRLPRLIGLASGLLSANGTLLALKGRGAQSEIDEVTETTDVRIELLTVPTPGEQATVLRVTGLPAARQPAGRTRKGLR